ncbi:MAG: hypothetical protein NC433_14615 [Clostridiales bacterium]|nr:hypothetical protein [Clostridiales bacterium]
MKIQQTIFDDWVNDFRKIIFCIGVLALGTLFNIKEPNALAIAVIVQGAGNIDGYWDYLKNHRLSNVLKIMIVILVLLSCLAVIFAIFDLSNSNACFDLNANQCAWYYIYGVVIAVAFPVVLLLTDLVLNLKNEKVSSIIVIDGGSEDEL